MPRAWKARACSVISWSSNVSVLWRIYLLVTLFFALVTVLGLVAVKGFAGLTEFDADYKAPPVVAFREKVSMVLDPEVDTAYPARWIGKVTVETTDGRRLEGRVDVPKGDPGNTLERHELEDKAIRLGTYRSGASEAEMHAVIARVWGLAKAAKVDRLLA